ncbi:serine/threonine-protein kinase [Amycolatopsis nigrescens]|uniref:serine/threonine-protein kinase n=1 Tax=Amycolatopsis nigrescens TaxID=381445 RepID=UPI00047820BE|nr:serine/threonine-protein kinase [Amycolatopsis nigrescens]
MKPLNPGEPLLIGRYRLLAALGEGGMGRVLLGVSPDGRLVAVKQVHPGFAHDEGFRSRFRREVETSRMVSGAYTAAVMDADPDAATPWLASVFVSGPSLRQAIDAAGPLPPHSVRYLAAGLASALTEIHRVGLIHRDLKPSNVLLTDDGPRVIDFGIARAVEGDTELTHTGSIIGSPGFMSPEQAESRPITPASDMFSLGALLVMASTGQGPFTGASTPQTLYNVVHTHPDLRMVPPELRRLAGPCLAKNPAKRPTPAQLLDFLGPAAPTSAPWPHPVHAQIAQQKAEVNAFLARPAPSPALSQAPASRAGRKRRTAWVATGCAAAILAVSAGVALLSNQFSDGDPPAQTSAAAAPPPVDPLSPDRLRLVDPCTLLDEQSFSRYGTFDNGALPANLDNCAYLNFSDYSGLIGGITVAVQMFSEKGELDNVQGLDAVRSEKGDSCHITARNPVDPSLGIQAVAINKAPDRCQIAKEMLDVAIRTLRGTPKLYPMTPGSLLPVNLCTVANKEMLQSIVGPISTIDDEDGRGLHSCQWSATQDVNIGLSNSSSLIKGKEVDLNGVKAVETPEDGQTWACELAWHHRIGQRTSEMVHLQVLNSHENKESTCSKAEAIAKAIIPGLPKP